jgi:hypothetical protein
MGAREFLVSLDEAQENRYRHRHVWEQRQIIEFRIQYEAFIEGAWHAIVRYDSAHGQPHQDMLHPDGSQTKQMFSYYTNAEVLTIGQRDIMEHWLDYRAAYEKEMGNEHVLSGQI